MKENKEEIEVQIFSSANEYEINQICAILTENIINDFIDNNFINTMIWKNNENLETII